MEEDPTVYQYDELYDEMEQKKKESKLSRKDLDKKPKYIGRLLAAAERRKKENERRIEKQIQKEREQEGEEFKDKESFVTSGYRKKLEEMKELEEQEKREEYLEDIGDVRKQGNLDGFYRHLYDQKVNYDDKVKQESEREEKPSNQEKETVAVKQSKRKYRTRNPSDLEEEAEESSRPPPENKMEHLPSNLDADSDFSIDSSDSDDEVKSSDKKSNEKEIKQDTQIKIETEPEKEQKEVEIEESEPVEASKKPKINIWKKRTIGVVLENALKRYLERKKSLELYMR